MPSRTTGATARSRASSWSGRMEVEKDEEETTEPTDVEVEEDLEDEPAVREGLGALGQLGVAVLVVAALVALFIGVSALLRRLFV